VSEREPPEYCNKRMRPGQGRGEFLQPLPGCVSLFLFYRGVASLTPGSAPFAPLGRSAQNLAKPSQPGMAMASETAMENTLIPISQGDSQAEVSDSATSDCQWLSEAFPLRMAAM